MGIIIMIITYIDTLLLSHITKSMMTRNTVVTTIQTILNSTVGNINLPHKPVYQKNDFEMIMVLFWKNV